MTEKKGVWIDDIMEQAKRDAAKKPNTEIQADLGQGEVFKVTYLPDQDTFDCSRTKKTPWA
jgi:hypothetical protein